MSSRYSLLWLKPSDFRRSSWTDSRSSKASTSASPVNTPQSSSFAYPPPLPSAFSYQAKPPPIIPMSMSMSSSSPTSSPPPPHPYHLAAYDSAQSPQSESPSGGNSGISNGIMHVSRNHLLSEVEGEKPTSSSGGGGGGSSTVGGHTTYTAPSSTRPLTRPRSATRTRRTSMSVYVVPPPPITLRPILLLLIFIPLPPLASLLYSVTGHAILRHTHPSPSSIYHHAPLSSSVEAGATGGIILAVPLALTLYLLYGPSKPPIPPSSSEPVDFFDDDDSVYSPRQLITRYSGYLACFFILVGIGGASGPLGVTILANGNMGVLTPGAAAAAGMLGGVLILSGVAVLSIIGLVCWASWLRRKQPQNHIG